MVLIALYPCKSWYYQWFPFLRFWVRSPWVRKIPWRKAWQPTPAFLPGESMDRGAWWPTVHWITKSRARLLQLSTHTDGAWWYCMVWFLTGLLRCKWCPLSGETLFDITTHCARVLSYVWVFVTPWTVCSPPSSSIYGINPARILEWVAISFSRGSFQPRDQICISWGSYIGRQILYHWANWEALLIGYTPNQNEKILQKEKNSCMTACREHSHIAFDDINKMSIWN